MVGEQQQDFWTAVFAHFNLKSTNVFIPVNMFVLNVILFLPVTIPGLANTKQFNLYFLKSCVCTFLINLSWKIDYFLN